MKRRSWHVQLTVASTLVAVVVAVVLLGYERHPAPVFRGRPLDQWLQMAASGYPSAQQTVIDAGPQALPTLIKALGTSDSPLRGFLRKAGEMLPPQIAVRLPDTPTALELRAVSARCLGALGPEAHPAIPALIAAFKGVPTDEPAGQLTFLALCEALERMEGAAVPALREGLNARNLRIRRGVVEVLGRLDTAALDAVPALVNALDGAAEDLARGICLTLGKLGPRAAPFVTGLTAKRRPASLSHQLRILDALTRIGRPPADWAAILENGLNSAEAEVRLQALETTRLFGPRAQALFPAVRRLLKDSQQQNRNRAVHCLGNLGPVSRPAVPEILAAFPDEANSQGPPDFATALSQFGPEILPELTAALAHVHPNIRLGAASALRQMGTQAAAAAPALVRSLGDNVRAVRREAAAALTQLDVQNPELLAGLVAAVNHPDWVTASAAANALGNLGPRGSAAVPALLAMLRTNDRCRADAVLALGSIRPPAPDVVAAMIDCLNDRNLSVGRAALEALAEMGPDAAAAAPAVRTALKDPFYLTSIKAARALWNLTRETNTVREALERALKDRVNLRLTLETLGDLGTAAEPSADFVAFHLEDRNLENRLAAAGAFWRIRRDAEPVLAMTRDPLRHGPLEACRQAAALLRQLGPEGRPLVPELIRCLKHDDDAVRTLAIDALAGVGAAALPELRKELTLGDLRTAVPVARICWRTTGQTDGLIDPLIEGLRHGDPAVRQAAVRTLGAMGGPAVLALTSALRDPLAAVRAGAARALGRMGSVAAPAVGGLQETRSDANAVVRFEAARAIEAIKSGLP